MAFGRRCRSRSLMVSVCFLGFGLHGCWLCRRQLCGAEVSREMSYSYVSSNLGVIFFFFVCFLGFPLKSRWNDWWLWSPKHWAGACFTAHRLLSLINLFTQTEDGNGWRRMERHGEKDEENASLLALLPIVTSPLVLQQILERETGKSFHKKVNI